MSNHYSSNEGFAPAPGKAARVALIIAGLFLAVSVLYVGGAAISTAVLNYKAPVSAEDLQHASWLVIPPSLSSIAALISFVCICVGSLKAWRGSAFGLVIIMVGALGLPTIFPSVSFRSAVLAGDAKVGCFDYNSRACAEMLKLPTNTSADQANKVKRKPSAPIEALAFVRAPFDVFKADQLNQMLEAQRIELKKHLGTDTELSPKG